MEKYFKNKKVKGIIISHRNYLDFNLLCKICYKIMYQCLQLLVMVLDYKIQEDEVNLEKIYKLIQWNCQKLKKKQLKFQSKD